MICYPISSFTCDCHKWRSSKSFTYPCYLHNDIMCQHDRYTWFCLAFDQIIKACVHNLYSHIISPQVLLAIATTKEIHNHGMVDISQNSASFPNVTTSTSHTNCLQAHEMSNATWCHKHCCHLLHFQGGNGLPNPPSF